MAFNARDEYTGSGITGPYSITFPYLEDSHVEVYLDGVLQVITTDYTLATSTTVSFVSTVAADVEIVILRNTPTTALVDFQDASVLTEAALDNAVLQSLYLSEETTDEAGLLLGTSGTYEAGSKRISAVADPVDGQDVATKAWIEANVTAGFYLGAQDADPTADLEGDALSEGDYFLNTTTNAVRIYSDGAWMDAVAASAGLPSATASGFGKFIVQSTDDSSYEQLSDQGSSGEILTSNGADALPSFQAPAAGIPTGVISMWPTATAPTGHLLCEGQTISRTTYADLYAVLGDIYGNGDGSTTFEVPDMRGQFVRGTDNGASIDPDAGSRTNRGDGTGGDNVGSKQAFATDAHSHSVGSLATASGGSHTHTFTGGNGVSGLQADVDDSAKQSPSTITTSSNGAHTHSISGTTGATSGSETRPNNIGLNFIIKI